MGEIKKMYLGKNITIKLNLKQDLYHLKIKKGGDLMNLFHGLVN